MNEHWPKWDKIELKLIYNQIKRILCAWLHKYDFTGEQQRDECKISRIVNVSIHDDVDDDDVPFSKFT